MPGKNFGDNVVHPELSYKIMGALFKVSNELGHGHKEKYYEEAVAVALKAAGLSFKRQIRTQLTFGDSVLGYYILDFLVEGVVVLELKQGRTFSQKNIDQVHSYLKANKLQLGIIAQFTSAGVKYKRVVNLQ